MFEYLNININWICLILFAFIIFHFIDKKIINKKNKNCKTINK